MVHPNLAAFLHRRAWTEETTARQLPGVDLKEKGLVAAGDQGGRNSPILPARPDQAGGFSRNRRLSPRHMTHHLLLDSPATSLEIGEQSDPSLSRPEIVALELEALPGASKS